MLVSGVGVAVRKHRLHFWSTTYVPGTIPSLPELVQLILTTHCCCCCCLVASVVSDSVRHHRRQPTRLPQPTTKQVLCAFHFTDEAIKIQFLFIYILYIHINFYLYINIYILFTPSKYLEYHLKYHPLSYAHRKPGLWKLRVL